MTSRCWAGNPLPQCVRAVHAVGLASLLVNVNSQLNCCAAVWAACTRDGGVKQKQNVDCVALVFVLVEWDRLSAGLTCRRGLDPYR